MHSQTGENDKSLIKKQFSRESYGMIVNGATDKQLAKAR